MRVIEPCGVVVQIGQILCLPTLAPPSDHCTNFYEVVDGDSCWLISARNDINEDLLERMNPFLDCSNLQVSQLAGLRMHCSFERTAAPWLRGKVLSVRASALIIKIGQTWAQREETKVPVELV